GIAAVGRPARELGVGAEVLEAAAAGRAGAVGAVEPGHADALAAAGDPAGHLVAEHHGPEAQRQVAREDLEVGAADAAGADLDEHLARPGHGVGDLALDQPADLFEIGRAHRFTLSPR